MFSDLFSSFLLQSQRIWGNLDSGWIAVAGRSAVVQTKPVCGLRGVHIRVESVCTPVRIRAHRACRTDVREHVRALRPSVTAVALASMGGAHRHHGLLLRPVLVSLRTGGRVGMDFSFRIRRQVDYLN